MQLMSHECIEHLTEHAVDGGALKSAVEDLK